MKKRIVFVVCFLLIGAIALSGCTSLLSLFATGEPLLYMVEDKETGGVIYLFGSIHVAPEAITFPDRIMDAYDKSEYLAVEYDILAADEALTQMNEQQLTEYYSRMMYTDGTTVRDHISAEVYEDAKAFLASYEMYDEFLDYYRAAMWDSMVTNVLTAEAGYNSDYGVDRYFLSLAHETDKKILEVESEDFQMGLLMGFDDRLYESMLKETLNTKDQYGASIAQLFGAWQTGNELLLTLFTSASAATAADLDGDGTLADLYNDYENKMITQRNAGMAKKAVEYLKEGKTVFYVVGCAHMHGGDGIRALLEDAGYTVTAVKP